MDDLTDKINVSGIEVSKQMPEDAVKTSLELMRSKGICSVFFYTSKQSALCQANPELVDIIGSCNLVVAGDKGIEDSVFSDGGRYEKEDLSGEYIDSYMDTLFFRLQKESRVVFIVAENEATLQKSKEYLNTQYDKIQVEGLVFKNYDNTVNEINAVIPDVLVLGVPLENQVVFLKEYVAMMNTKLILSFDSLERYIKRMTSSVPNIIKALHLENVYHWIKKEPKNSKSAT